MIINLMYGLRTNKETAIGIYFRSTFHNIKHFHIQPILQIYTGSHIDRLQQENIEHLFPNN